MQTSNQMKTAIEDIRLISQDNALTHFWQCCHSIPREHTRKSGSEEFLLVKSKLQSLFLHNSNEVNFTIYQ